LYLLKTFIAKLNLFLRQSTTTTRNSEANKEQIMNLNTLSQSWLEATGSGVGFMFKSSVSGKVFKTTAKTSSDKYLCVSEDGTKEVLLDGTVDRYVMFGGSTRIAEINAKIAELEAKRDAIESEINALEDEADDLGRVG